MGLWLSAKRLGLWPVRGTSILQGGKRCKASDYEGVLCHYTIQLIGKNEFGGACSAFGESGKIGSVLWKTVERARARSHETEIVQPLTNLL